MIDDIDAEALHDWLTWREEHEPDPLAEFDPLAELSACKPRYSEIGSEQADVSAVATSK